MFIELNDRLNQEERSLLLNIQLEVTDQGLRSFLTYQVGRMTEGLRTELQYWERTVLRLAGDAPLVDDQGKPVICGAQPDK